MLEIDSDVDGLAMSHMGIADFVARTRFFGRDRDDAAQEARLAMIKAARRYDGRAKYSTYAFKTAQGAVLHASRKERLTRKTTVSGERPMHVSIPCDSRSQSGDDRLQISSPSPSPEDDAITSEVARAIGNVIDCHLTPSQARVIRMRFGFSGHDEHTLEEIGSVLGVSRERVRQIQCVAIGRLARFLGRFRDADREVPPVESESSSGLDVELVRELRRKALEMAIQAANASPESDVRRRASDAEYWSSIAADRRNTRQIGDRLRARRAELGSLDQLRSDIGSHDPTAVDRFYEAVELDERIACHDLAERNECWL